MEEKKKYLKPIIEDEEIIIEDICLFSGIKSTSDVSGEIGADTDGEVF